MSATRRLAAIGYWLLTLALFAATVAMVFLPEPEGETMSALQKLFFTPVEKTMGPVQKIFYLHLPVAINTFVAALIVFIASIGYLWQRKAWWDDLAAAAGKVTVLFCAVVLLTGMVWGKSAWGAWWTWSPRLTFSLVLLLLYIVYLMIRPAIESPHRRAVVSAVYGIAAFLDVPLVYLSTKLMDDIHPQSISLEPAMTKTLLAWFVPVTMLMGGLVVARFRLNRRTRALDVRNAQEAEQTVGEVRIGETA